MLSIVRNSISVSKAIPAFQPVSDLRFALCRSSIFHHANLVSKKTQKQLDSDRTFYMGMACGVAVSTFFYAADFFNIRSRREDTVRREGYLACKKRYGQKD